MAFVWSSLEKRVSSLLPQLIGQGNHKSPLRFKSRGDREVGPGLPRFKTSAKLHFKTMCDGSYWGDHFWKVQSAPTLTVPGVVHRNTRKFWLI